MFQPLNSLTYSFKYVLKNLRLAAVNNNVIYKNYFRRNECNFILNTQI